MFKFFGKRYQQKITTYIYIINDSCSQPFEKDFLGLGLGGS